MVLPDGLPCAPAEGCPAHSSGGCPGAPAAEPGAHKDRDLVCIELGLALVRHDLAEVAAPFFDEATAAILDDSFDVRHGARASGIDAGYCDWLDTVPNQNR